MKFKLLLCGLLVCVQAYGQALRIDNLGKTYRGDNTYTGFTLTPSGNAQFDGELLGNGAFLRNVLHYEARNYDIRAMSKVLTTTLPTLTGISGATYNARSGTLFVIKNEAGAGETYEVSRDGAILRTIINANFEDTEAIEWVLFDPAIGVDVFLVAEENPQQRLSLVRLSPAATALDRTTAGNVSVFTGYTGGNIANLGIESVCYDSKRGLIYYTAEKRTGLTQTVQGTQNAAIYQRSFIPTGTMSFGTESLLAPILTLYDGTLDDISDMAYDSNQDNLLLLSDESNKIVRISRAGTLLEDFSISGFTQPEGLTLHPLGQQLWVVGESNEIGRYQIGSDNVAAAAPGEEGTYISIPGTDNLFIGVDVGNPDVTGTKNVATGRIIGAGLTSGEQNTLIGFSTGSLLTGGIQNTYIGSVTGYSSTVGSYNTGVGVQSLYSLTEGQNNSGFGVYSLSSVTLGWHNCGFGYNALGATTIGEYNIGIGHLAGNTNITGSYNIALGVEADFTTAALTNAIAIGKGAVAPASNTISIGGTGADAMTRLVIGDVVIAFGTNTPEGAVTAPVGSLFLRRDGGAATVFWVKESGVGATGWVAK